MLLHTLTTIFQPPGLATLPLGRSLGRSLNFPLLARLHRRPLVDVGSEGGDDSLHDVVHVSALGGPGREFDHVALAERVVGVRHQVGGELGEGLLEVRVPSGVAVDDADGTVHAADRFDGALLERVGIGPERGGSR